MRKPKSIDDYLAGVDGAQHAALVKLRKTVRSVLPEAVECISYAMPAFRYQGQVVAGFLATRDGCSYYPFSGRTLATLAAEVEAYEQTKGALHFDPKHPLPLTLVRKLLRTRIAEAGSKVASKRRAKPKSRRA